MPKYLYGASVQGIQGFIFETNRLREITGASEIVEQICTSIFEKEVISSGSTFNDENLITGAAGNIKYVFDSKTDCSKVFLTFPKTVMELAPGITISQSVVEFETENPITDDLKTLEVKLRTKRNKPITQHSLGLMISERARRTGKAGIKYHNEEVIDKSTSRKLKKVDDASFTLMNKVINGNHKGKNTFQKDDFQKNIEKILEKTGGRGWLAIIHADGNNLGKSLQSLAENEAIKNNAKMVFREFSRRLDHATIQSAHNAYENVIQPKFNDESLSRYPFRPVVLGGDDISMIIRGDLAIPFLAKYLEEFEKNTKEEFQIFNKENGTNLFTEGMTACAGIAFIKPNYPFHYGINLAESLCSHAKNISKGMDKENPQSSLMFHKVHSSFVEDYKTIIERELTPQYQKGISIKDESKTTVPRRFNHGPYFLKPSEDYGYSSVQQLLDWVELIKEDEAPKSSLRKWLSELDINQENAMQDLERISNITEKRYKNYLRLDNVWTNKYEIVEEPEKGKSKKLKEETTHIHDLISLSQIM